MASEASDAVYMTQQQHRGDVRGRSRHPQQQMAAAVAPYQVVPPMPSSDPYAQYYAQEDKRAMADSRCGGPQYPSWPPTQYHPAAPAASGHPSTYPSNDAKAFPMPYHPMPHHGMPQMHVPPQHALGGPMPPQGMVTPQPPMFGIAGLRTATSKSSRSGGAQRVDSTETSSSSNCTPRDHYGNEKSQYGSNKRHNKRNDGSPRLPVVKIPETLKKLGQPSPAPWLNSRGFPLRMGKPDCKHYISKGWCAYGTLCKFNHPDAAGMSAPMPCAMIPAYHHGQQQPMVSSPWGVGMAASYPWGAWNQQPQMYPMPHPGACYPYMCPCPTACPTESGNSTTSNVNGGESDKATDAESVGLYN